MTRVTEKALRPRQYVFESVARERRPLFVRRIRLLRNTEARAAEKEKRRAAERIHETARNVAIRSEAEKPSGGDKTSDVLVALKAEERSLVCERERLLLVLGKAAAAERTKGK